MAGLLLALDLRDSGLKIGVIETGSWSPQDAYQALNRSVTQGLHYDTDESRARAVGGSLHLWAGRCGTLDPIDFLTRKWVEGSGWPINLDHLLPHYQRALEMLQSPVGVEQLLDSKGNGTDPLVAAGFERKPLALLDHVNGDFVRRHLRPAVDKSGTITFVRETTVVSLETLDGETIDHCLAVRDDGKSGISQRFAIRAGRFIVACGGLETVRLLLASNSFHPNGVGNQHDRVGRHFTDHPRMKSGSFSLADRHMAEQIRTKGKLHAAYRFPDAAQERDQMLNHAFTIGQSNGDVEALASTLASSPGSSGPKGMIRSASKRLWRRAPGWMRAMLKHLLAAKRGRRHVLIFKVELEPNAESRIVLSGTRDRHGVPLLQTQWIISQRDRLRLASYFEKVNAALVSAGIVRDPIRMPDVTNDASFVDSSHPIGATRMAESAAEGVVDSELRVFGTRNLYLCSSSVFPTPGSINPTLTIGALALRLSAHLKAQVAEGHAGFGSVPNPLSALEPGMAVSIFRPPSG